MESHENFFLKSSGFSSVPYPLVLYKEIYHYSTMNFITVIKNLLPKKIQKPVGRWRLENCKSSMNQKIDLGGVCWNLCNPTRDNENGSSDWG